jgi:hypothetical protein
MSSEMHDSVEPLAFLRGVVEEAGHSFYLTCRHHRNEEVDVTLRITRDEGSRSRATLRLEGSIVSEWSTLLGRECFRLLRSWGAVSLDLGAVGFIDRAGVEVLARLSRAGVEIRCPSGPVASVLEGEGVRITRNAGSAEQNIEPA